VAKKSRSVNQNWWFTTLLVNQPNCWANFFQVDTLRTATGVEKEF
jgi:hypothetical protein